MKQINMLESPVRQVFFSYLVPSISATLVTSIYILADTMMIGRGVGGSGIAAMNILLPLYNTYFGIGMMCGVGGSVLFGFSRGRGDEKRARSYFTAALCVVLALSAVFLILGRIFFNPLITFMGNTPLLNEYTVPYGTVLTTAAPMFALSSFLQAFVRNDGAPRLAMAGDQRRRHQCDPGLCIHFYHEMGNGRCGAGDGHRNDTHGADPRKPFFLERQSLEAGI